LLQILGEGRARSHRLRISACGHRYKDFSGADVDTRGIGLQHRPVC
jgi:hypothetical protein